MDTPYVLWGGFHLLILLLLLLDLGVFHRRIHAISVREALFWSGFWVVLALLFNAFIYFDLGSEKGLQFFTGYLVEKSLSVDNLFVFFLIFSHFQVPPKFQHKVLFWGIIGALILRLSLILSGIALIQAFHWVTYLFGAFLCVTAVKFVLDREESIDLKNSWLIRLCRKICSVAPRVHGGRFFFQGKITSLFLVLVLVEVSDVIFALDSIPAVFAITTDPFLVYTSNVFAILGLRSLYFALAGFAGQIRVFKVGLAAILAFTGIKMLGAPFFSISGLMSLAVIGGILLVSACASVLFQVRQK